MVLGSHMGFGTRFLRLDRDQRKVIVVVGLGMAVVPKVIVAFITMVVVEGLGISFRVSLINNNKFNQYIFKFSNL